MSVSTYFSKFDHANEQNLYEDIIIESIRIYGMDCYYIPRTLNKVDNIFGEDVLSSFTSSYPIEMYIKNVNGFEGEGDFISRFGLEIRDQITFSVARRRFQSLGLGIRPKEGDLIYFPLTKHLFEIRFVEHEAFFYQTGRLQTFDITCEKFEYSDETIDTGIGEIDQIEVDYSYVENIIVDTVTGTFQVDENVTGSISGHTAKIQKLDLGANTIVVGNITGPFTLGEIIRGATSNATANVTSANTDFVNDPQANNSAIQTLASSIIDFSESNPFSEGQF